MIRVPAVPTVLCALSIAAALATPASAADGVVVKLAGKSPAEAYAAISQAARTVCRAAYASQYRGVYLSYDCVKETVARTVAMTKSPSLAQFARNKEAEQSLASS